jgi:5,10-methylenetetrahydrofolate reductase
MPRTLAEALSDRPLFFEPVPPSSRLASAKVESRVEELVRLVQGVGRVDALDVPELVDENHEGRPYHRSGDPRWFASRLGAHTGCEVIVNKVVAHLASGDALAEWARDSVQRGIRNLVLVGGSSRYIPYPGPSVTEANRICRPILEPASGMVGNIAIPQRTGEAHRMLQKTRAGARFFTTQILFDSEAVLKLLREYDSLCLQAGLQPSAVLLSVAPIADEGDVEFVRWLGADFPEEAEDWILTGDESAAAARSVENALDVWERVSEVTRVWGASVSTGVNVEQLSPRHLANAGEMLAAFAQVLSEPAPASSPAGVDVS